MCFQHAVMDRECCFSEPQMNNVLPIGESCLHEFIDLKSSRKAKLLGSSGQKSHC